MKRREDIIWQKYQKGERDFQKEDLSGLSFKNRDLSGANFSGANFSNCNIQGTNFTSAKLENTNFTGATAGVKESWFYGALILSIFSGLMGGFLSALFIRYFVNTGSEQIIDRESIGWLSIGALTFYMYLSYFEGFGNAIWKTLLGIWSLIFLIFGSASVFLGQPQWGTIALDIAKTSVMSMTAYTFNSLVLTTGNAIVGDQANTVAGISAIVGVLSIRFIAKGSSHQALVNLGIVGLASCCLFALVNIGLSAGIARQALAGDEKHDFICTLVIMVAAKEGTNFKRANLKGADFSKANLKNTDFTNAYIWHTRWLDSLNLELAWLTGQILDNPDVRELLVNNALRQGKSYKGINLSGANLTGADLTDAQFQETILDGAILKNACLEGAFLTKVRASGTDFSGAKLTGACIEDWGIDWTTILDQVDCRYVWVQEEPDKETGERKRSPASKFYDLGDFAELHQQIRDTVEIFFSKGLDPEAFKEAFKKAQEKYGLVFLQKVERKENDFFVINFRVPANVNHNEFHYHFKQNYDWWIETFKLGLQKMGLPPLKFPTQPNNQLFFPDEPVSISIPNDLEINSPGTSEIIKGKDSAAILHFIGDFQQGFPSVFIEIFVGGMSKRRVLVKKLSPEPKLVENYVYWQHIYNKLAENRRAIEAKNDGERNFGLKQQAKKFEYALNKWLHSEEFRPIQEILDREFQSSEEFRVIIESENVEVQRIPWCLWYFFDYYEKAEVAVSLTNSNQGEKDFSKVPRNQLRVLVILGNSEGINIEADKSYLQEKLTDTEIVFLLEPTRREFHDALWEQQGFDILYFSGHSASETDGSTGKIQLNRDEEINLKDYKDALKAVVKKGLQLAIFNSCDGLGLARDLASLDIPQTIIMRESVPDEIAQSFLKQFLDNFVQGNSLYFSVRLAREYLRGLEHENIRYICASWLPVIFQNPTMEPISWPKLLERYS